MTRTLNCQRDQRQKPAISPRDAVFLRFTLIELLVVIAIIAILSALSL